MATPSSFKSRALAALRRLGTLVLTLFVIAGAVGAVMAGRTMLAEQKAEAAAPAATEPTTVAVAPITFTDSYTMERRFAGQIEPAQTTTVSFEFGGTLTTLGFDEGDTIAEGTVLAELDTRLLDARDRELAARREALEAQAELARRTNARQETLQARGFASVQARDNAQLGLAELTARLAEVDAARVSVDVRRDKSVLRAPFDGVVSKRHVDLGSTLGAGAPVITLVKKAAPEFRVGLPPALLRTLSEGAPATVAFGDTMVPVTRAAVLPELDAATRTRTVLFDVAGGERPPFGETGELLLTATVEERGAFVPLSALSDGPRGLWRLLTVVEGPDGATVVPEMATILFIRGEEAYVTGTFADGATIITDGPHRIVPGERVLTVPAERRPDEMSIALATE